MWKMSVPVQALKLSRLSLDCTWRGDHLETPEDCTIILCGLLFKENDNILGKIYASIIYSNVSL